MKRIIPIACLLFIAGCVSQPEYDRVLAENQLLKNEIEELKNGPDRLLRLGKTKLENKAYDEAKGHFISLIERHEGTAEAEEAANLVAEIQKHLEIELRKLEKERLAAEKAERERLANATRKLRKEYDDVKEITWYYDRSLPSHADISILKLYIGKSKTTQPFLRFVLRYSADDWLFIENYTIKTDNDTYTITPMRGEVERDNGGGVIWEWYDTPMNVRYYHIIKDIINSKSAKIRYNGRQYYRDKVITVAEKQAFKNLLDGYEALGGDLTFN